MELQDTVSSNRKIFGAVLGTGLFLVLLSVGISQASVFYLNSMVDPVNQDAEFPEQSFENLSEKIDREDKDFSIRDPKGTVLEKRLKLSGTGLIDVAVAGGNFFEALNSSKNTVEKLGRKKVSACKTSKVFHGEIVKCSRDIEYQPRFSKMYKGWFEIILFSGELDEVYRNKTARKTVLNYIKRADYYDSYLIPGGYQPKPIEAAYYSSRSGLHILGSSDKPLYVDGEKVNLTGDSFWQRANLNLSTGPHSLRRANFTMSLPVYENRLNSAIAEDGKLLIEGVEENSSRFFETATIEGTNRTIKLNLTENTSKVKAPEGLNSITYRKGNFSVKVRIEKASDKEIVRPMRGEAFGMSRKEYLEFRKLMKKFGFLFSDYSL